METKGTEEKAITNETDKTLILVEKEEGRIVPLTLELLGAGRRLAESNGGTLCACVLGHGISDLSNEIAYYADEVYVIDHASLADFQVDLYASALESLCQVLKPGAIIMGYDYDNFELAPKISCRIKNELITDCIGIERDVATGHLLCTKPVYGGNAIAVFELSAHGIVTIRPKTYEAASPGQSKGEIIPFTVEMDSCIPLSETLSVVEEESVNMGAAEVIVSGGRGASSPEKIKELENVITLLKRRFQKVELGASRPLVDAGLVPHSRQVGQTGERVAPGIYFALGISGAAQHLSGMVGSKKIIAINKSEEAPIFKAADYGVVGLLEEVIPGFVRKLEELL